MKGLQGIFVNVGGMDRMVSTLKFLYCRKFVVGN